MDEKEFGQIDQARFFRALAENAADGIAVIDAKGQLIFANQVCHDQFGYDYAEQEMIGLPVGDLWPAQGVTRWVEDILPQGEDGDWQGHVHQKRKDGSLFEAQLTVFSVADGEEHPAQLAILIREANGHASTLEHVADLERESILDSLSEHVIYQDLDHRIVWSNQAANQSVEEDREALKGRYCYEIWPRRDDRCPDCPVAEAMETGQPQQTEKQTPDGRYWQVRGYPVRDEEGNIVGGIEVTQDITERQRADTALHDSVKRFRAMAENIRDGLTIVEGREVAYVNERLTEITGYSEEALKSMTGVDLAAPEEKDRLQKVIQEVRESGKPLRELEYWITRKDGERRFVRNRYSHSVTDDGTPLRFVTTTDLTERKKMAESLDRSERKYEDLYFSVRDGIASSDMEGNIVECNPAFEEMIGYSLDELKGMTFNDLTPPKWHAMEAEILREQALTRGYTDLYQKEYIRKDGTVFPAEVTVYLSTDEQGEPVGYWGVVRDITEQERAEENLRVSQERLSLAMEAAQTGIWELWPQSGEVYYSPMWYQMLGYESNELPQEYTVWRELLHPEDLSRATGVVNSHIASGEDFSLQFRMQTKEGDWRWIQAHGYIVEHTPEGEAQRIIGTHTDITERKQAEENLRQSEARLSRIIDNMGVMFDVLDEDGNIIVWNKECERVTGFTADEIVGNPRATELLYPDPDYRQMMFERWAERVNEDFSNWEWDVTCKDGTVKTISWTNVSNSVPVSGWPSWYTGVDVTERKKVEQQVRRSLKRRSQQVQLTTEIAQQIARTPALSDLYERVVTLVKERFGYYHVHIFRYDAESNMMRLVEGYGPVGEEMMNAEYSLPYGEGIVGRAAATGEPVLIPDVTEVANWEPHLNLTETKGELAVPIIWQRDVLGVLDVQSDQVGALTEEDQVVLLGLAGQIASAIESTNLIDEVQESQRFLDTIIDNIPNPIFYQDAQGVYLGCNEAYLEYLGESYDEVRGSTVYDITSDPELAELYHQMDMEMIQNPGTESYEAEVDYADGSTRDVLFYKTTYRNPDGSVGGLIGTFLDITERKQMEEALQESEERYRSYIDNAPDGIFVADEKGRYLEVNDAACRITGYDRAELLRMQIIDLLPPKSMEEAGKHFQELSKMGKATGDFKFLRKDGAERYWTVEAVKLSDTRFLGFTKDITERKRTERMLSDRIKELNFLTAVGQKIAEEPAIPALLKWVVRRIPPAMQYPDICVAAIEYGDGIYGQEEALDLPCQVVAGLRIGGERVGRIYVAYTEERAFLDEESAMLGGIVRRLESYVEQQKASQELEKRARQLSAVAEVANATGVILDPDKLIRRTVDMVLDRFDLYYVGLFLVDDEKEWAVLRTGTGEAGHQMVEANHRLKVGGDSMIGWCVANEQARIALDVGEEAVRFDNPYLPETRSELALPVIARGETIGALSIQSTEVEAFSEEDITVFQTLVDQVATAIENARLFEQTQEALAQAETLYRGSSAITQAQTMDDVLQVLIQLTAFENLNRATFLLFDRPFSRGESPEAFTVEAAWESEGTDPGMPVGTRYDFDQFPAGRLVARDEPTIVKDVTTDERLDDSTRELILERMGSRSISFWPLRVGEQWIGLFSGLSATSLDMSGEDIRQVTSLADQAAAVIQNQLLVEQTQDALAQTETLYNISQKIIAADEAEDMLQVIASSAMQADAVAATLFYVDTDADGDPVWAEVVARVEATGPNTLPVGTRYHIKEFPLGHLMTANPYQNLVIDDVNTHEAVDEPTAQVLQHMDIGAMVVIPLTMGKRWVGIITVDWDEPHKFSSQERRLYGAVGPQLAALIESRRLLDEAETRARREQALREITARVRGYTDPDAIARAAVRELGTALGRPAFVRLGSAEELSDPPSSGDGGKRGQGTEDGGE